ILELGVHFSECPSEIDRRGARSFENPTCVLKACIGRIFPHVKADTVSRRGADERCAPDHHGFDRMGSIAQGFQGSRREHMRELRLVDDFYRPPIRIGPNRSVVFALDLHGWPPVAALSQFIQNDQTAYSIW